MGVRQDRKPQDTHRGGLHVELILEKPDQDIGSAISLLFDGGFQFQAVFLDFRVEGGARQS
jgi:hypothetical protein